MNEMDEVNDNIEIRKMEKEDADKIARIASASFSGMKDPVKSEEWIICNFSAFPRMQYFVALQEDSIIGYILWMEKGGFRQESVWELEQIAVIEEFQGKNIGTLLIKQSLEEIKKQLKERNVSLKLIMVTTGKSNEARRLYKKALGAEPEAVLRDIFRGDEVIMVARF